MIPRSRVGLGLGTNIKLAILGWQKMLSRYLSHASCGDNRAQLGYVDGFDHVIVETCLENHRAFVCLSVAGQRNKVRFV